MDISVEVSKKPKVDTPYGQAKPLYGVYLKDSKLSWRHWHINVIVALARAAQL